MFDGVIFTEGVKLLLIKMFDSYFLALFCSEGRFRTVWTIKYVKSRSSKVVFLDPLVILIGMRVLISLNEYYL